MSKSQRTKRVKMRKALKALKLATGALAFYAAPESYQYRGAGGANPPITPAATIDGGKLARMTLDDLAKYLDDDAQCALRCAHWEAGEDD